MKNLNAKQYLDFVIWMGKNFNVEIDTIDEKQIFTLYSKETLGGIGELMIVHHENLYNIYYLIDESMMDWFKEVLYCTI